MTPRLVDCDVHPAPPAGSFAALLPTRRRREVERYGTRALAAPNYPQTVNAGKRGDAFSARGVAGDDLELMRSQLLDEYGIDLAVLNTINPWDRERPELAADGARAVNDWLVSSWLDADPRLRASIVVPFETPEAAVRELEARAADGRFVQVMLPGEAAEPLGSRRYFPVYEAAAAHRLPLALHIGGFLQFVGAGPPSTYLERHVGYSIDVRRQLLSLVCSGLFEEVPSTRLVLVEGGFAWAAALAWELDAAWERFRDDLPRLERRPSEVLREHVWFTTQPIEEPPAPETLVALVEGAALGERLLFATDYPHWDFDAPPTALPRAFPDPVRSALRSENACALYGFDDA